jgi:heme/copper-type cytochrome/quinol oxidase subunit 3
MSDTSRSKAQVPGEIGIWAFVAGDLVVFSVFFLLLGVGQ